MFHVTFKVDGQPRGKGRPRFARRGAFVSTYTVRQAAQKSMGSSEPLKTALDAFIYISFAIPLSYSKKRKEACLNGLERHTKKPDIDNVVKAVLDGCDKVIFENDCQIVNLYVTKKYGEPCVEVLIRETE
jgi:Holliday junction resolvase RusA-like endonuclease